MYINLVEVGRNIGAVHAASPTAVMSNGTAVVEDTFASELSTVNSPQGGPEDEEEDVPNTDDDLASDENADDGNEDVVMHDVSDERGIEDVAGLFGNNEE